MGPPLLAPVERLPRFDAVRTITLVAVLAALAIVGRIAFLWAPNYALTYFVVFFSGVLLGPLGGAAVGLIAMTGTNLLLSGLHPVLLANALAMAALGLIGGWSRRLFVQPPKDRIDRVLVPVIAGAIGLFGTFLFSVLGDLVGYFLQFVVTPEGSIIGSRALVPMLLLGLVFNLGPALVNMVLFASATPALVAVLQRSGHLRGLPGPGTKRVTDVKTARSWGTDGRTPAPAVGTTRPDRP